MSFTLPKGWTRENDKLFIHTSDVRIQFMSYRGKEGWYIVPDDLDVPLIPFDPTPDGRDKAFEAFDSGVLKTKTKSKAASEKKKKAKPLKAPPLDEEGEVKAKPKDPDAEGDEEEEEEKEEKEDEGDDA